MVRAQMKYRIRKSGKSYYVDQKGWFYYHVVCRPSYMMMVGEWSVPDPYVFPNIEEAEQFIEKRTVEIKALETEGKKKDIVVKKVIAGW